MNTRAITKSAIMIALATVLSLVTFFKLPNGGSVTAASMVPIIIIALSSKLNVALITSLVYVAIQMVQGFYPPPTQDVMSFFLVIMLDYVVAFGVLGFAGAIANKFKNRVFGAAFATGVVCFIRFLCHFTSGILVWNSYAGDTAAWLYSLYHNGSYMLIEGIVSVVVIVLLMKAAPKLFSK